MFAHWLFVRLNTAERAVREGRIDDACLAVEQADLRAHPRGQRLIDELARPLLARARLRRQSGLYGDALADLDRLVTLGRDSSDAQELRRQIQAEMRAQAQTAAERQAAAGRVANDLRAGRLETVRLDLERVPDARQREQLADELDLRVRRGTQLLEQANEALGRGDALAAARFWQEACQRHGRTRETDEFATRLAAAARPLLERWLAEGQVNQLLAARACLCGLSTLEPSLAEYERWLALCERAVAQLSGGDYPSLRQTLLRLKAVPGEAKWLDAALAELGHIAAAQDALLASPLGTIASLAGPRPGSTPVPNAAASALVAALPVAADAPRLNTPLLLLIDGGGSSLLVARDLVRLGRGGADVDVPIPGDIQSHHADLVRHGEDYFLTAYGPTEINGRRQTHTLVRDGDRIVLGPNVKMVFCKPSAKSESAVLRLSHRCRLSQDVGDVVLFRDTCLVGPGTSCHVRTREGRDQFVLFERGGALFARQTAGGGWETAPPRALQLGQTLELGELRLTVKNYDLGAAEA
jgi:hypothetical protein